MNKKEKRSKRLEVRMTPSEKALFDNTRNGQSGADFILRLMELEENLGLDEYEKDGDLGRLTIFYPNVEGNTQEVDIDFMDVRVIYGIRVSFDFDRNGWVIKQHVDYSMDEWEETDFIDNMDHPETLKFLNKKGDCNCRKCQP